MDRGSPLDVHRRQPFSYPSRLEGRGEPGGLCSRPLARRRFVSCGCYPDGRDPCATLVPAPAGAGVSEKPRAGEIITSCGLGNAQLQGGIHVRACVKFMVIRKTITVGPLPVIFSNENRTLRIPLHRHSAEVRLTYSFDGNAGFPVLA